MNPNDGKTYSVEFVGGQVRISKEHWGDLLKEHADLETQLVAEKRKVEIAVKALRYVYEDHIENSGCAYCVMGDPLKHPCKNRKLGRGA